MNMFRLAAERKGIAFRVLIPDRLPRIVRMDQQRVRQILINLIGNAVKFTSRGEVAVHIRYSGDIARFDIVDTGPGIEEADIERIFHPFQRANTTPHTDDGTGLGLTISRMITVQMGGELTVESELGAGSTFRLRLALPELRGAKVGSKSKEVTGYRGAKRRILLVDDQLEHRAVVRNMLEPLGFDIFESESGEECLRVISSIKPDALLVDLVMPGMSGLDVCRTLRNGHWSQPILAVSANVFERDREQAAAAGCNAFVAKPVRMDELLEQLQLHLALEWIHDGAPPEPNPAPEEDPAIPPMRHLLAIREHARIGYVKGINEEIERIDATDPLYQSYISRLRELSRQFRTREIIELIEDTLSREYSTSPT
jgi:CheY-like chemotaxis protein/anti-sigma regulatory factor (Ser/Thr protein kinase)